MVDIYPFKAMMFNTVTGSNDISQLVSPPYDVISPAQKENLKKLSKNNIVNLILPDEENSIDRYISAAKKLNKWIKSNVLTFDDTECFYIFEESFLEKGRWKSFNAFIGLNKIEEYESLKVLRHEYTLSKPKEDRLNLLRQTGTNFGLIYTLYDDKEKKIQKILDNVMQHKPLYDFKPEYDAGIRFKIWKIGDTSKINLIVNFMKDINILIADGHHRYETSRLFMHEVKEMRRQNKVKSKKLVINSIGKEIFPEEAALTLFVNFRQENIKILPTYRMIKFENSVNYNDIKSRLKKYFTVNDYSEIFQEEYTTQFQSGSDKKNRLLNNIMDYINKSKIKGIHSFCFILAHDGIIIADLNKKITDIYGKLSRQDEIFENLDVRILHKLIIDNLFSDLNTIQIDYTHSINELADRINEDDKYDMGVILNAPDISDVEYLSSAGKVMPQKSTYFYPKPCSGLLMYRMDLQD
ncbi:MAG: DUF1015 domain-containing protein [Actinobacteria bacterium]|nr:DUF1015 domain-containing protein [Actinomycetota bacterium]